MRRGASRHDDGGQLLLLAGIILVLSFVAMAFTMSQVADVEKQASSEREHDFVREWRFLQGKLGGVLRDSTGETTDEESFRVTFESAVANHRNALTSKGYDARITLGSLTSGLGTTECSYLDLSPPCAGAQQGVTEFASVETEGGTEPLTHTYDGTDDGIIWMCGTGTGFIAAAVVHMSINDGTTDLAETIVFAVNPDIYAERMAMPAGSRC